MTDNPALRQRGQDVRIVLFDGTAATVNGVIGLFETSVGEASAPFADSGPVAWLDYDGDGQKIEFVEYTDEATGQRLHRRKIKAEKVGTVFPIWKIHMTVEATELARADFSAVDFDPQHFSAE